MRIECLPREADDHDDNAHVDDISTVTTSVARGEFKYSFGERQFLFRLNGARALPELDEDGREDESAQAERDQSTDFANACGQENDSCQKADQRGYLERLFQASLASRLALALGRSLDLRVGQSKS